MKRISVLLCLICAVVLSSCSKPNVKADYFAGLIATYKTPVMFYDFATEKWFEMGQGGAYADFAAKAAELNLGDSTDVHVSFRGQITDSIATMSSVDYVGADVSDDMVSGLQGYYTAVSARKGLMLSDNYLYVEVRAYEEKANDTIYGTWGMVSSREILLQPKSEYGTTGESFSVIPNLQTLVSMEKSDDKTVYSRVSGLK